MGKQQLSRFHADSALSRQNAAAGQPVVVPPALRHVFGVALEAARLSDGLVQLTMLTALEVAGYDRSSDAIARQGTVARAGTRS